MDIFKTRLYKPMVSKGYMVRKRLILKMNANHNKSTHIIVAAAGYGKSVFVSQWLDTIETPHCWISLDKDCNSLMVLMGYFYEALIATSLNKFKSRSNKKSPRMWTFHS